MLTRMRIFGKISFVLFLVILSSCKEDTIQPELFGSITGLVMNENSSGIIEGAGITTTPPTSAILTGSDGKFAISNIPVGNYTISAEKNGFKKGSVSVSVRENSTAQATIFLQVNSGLNSAPNEPINPIPSNAANNQPINLTLKWKGSDPDPGDSLSFTVYLYKSGSAIQQIITSGKRDTTANVENLNYNTTYFWQVVAEDSSGLKTNGNTWSFTTSAFPNNPIVFAQKVDDNYEIFSSDTAASIIIRLTNKNARDWWPRFNSKRSKIAFTSDENIGANIYTMNPDGSNIFCVTNIPVAGYQNYGIGFCWSSDNGKFFYSNNDKLISINVNGSGRKEIATAPSGRNFREVEQSPQGDKLVVLTVGNYIYDSEIYLMNSDGSNMTMLIGNAKGITERPSFNLDGTKILYTHDVSGYQSADGRQLDSHIFIYSIDGSDSVDVSINKIKGTNDTNPRFSPDGSKIIFNNTPNDASKNSDIWLMDTDGNNRTKIISNGEMPDWK